MIEQEDHTSEPGENNNRGLLRITYPILKIQGWLIVPLFLLTGILANLRGKVDEYPEFLNTVAMIYGISLAIILGPIWLIDLFKSMKSFESLFKEFDTGRYFPIVKHLAISVIILGLCHLVAGILACMIWGIDLYTWPGEDIYC